ncbi:hypothetical protein PRIPAC_95281 [Pristionchus pacificus]|uniref:Uncharacterized protein n=1 Tax=Pristionchus pacificus TaxID=54126 RepID=A0A2A6D107_PRIPA|nr:hypothetical protein PRIPAC_95281 [Pristionchus pacificus]|eukprot:PDM84144.1 hypothetical protein PRIPAC_34336 [Pristionchus pacificus]
MMPPLMVLRGRLRFLFAERHHDSNFASAFLNLIAATMAITALGSNEWLLIENGGVNATMTEEGLIDLSVPPLRAQPCENIGARDFWKQMRIGGYTGLDGKTHVVFHAPGRILVDCISPTMATLFYALIGISFSISIIGSAASFLHIAAPQGGFPSWMRRNTILEMCITLIGIGPGLFLITASGLFSFVAAGFAIRHWANSMKGRRLDNQRLTRPRALPSWRGVERRQEDQLPIIDFEGYLDMGYTPKAVDTPVERSEEPTVEIVDEAKEASSLEQQLA